MIRALLAVLVLALPADAQQVAVAPGAVVRWLDKVSGLTADLDLVPGVAQTQGYLSILLDECRYPVNDPASDAYAHLTIRDSRADAPVFSGWMIADSPALSAMDHPRYDVWVLRCTTP